MDTVYVAFRDCDKWFKGFLTKGYGHCCVLLPLQDGWLLVEPLHGRLTFKAVTDEHVTRYTRVLRVKVSDYDFKGFPIKLLTCVTFVESMLGKNTHAYTPHRLYQKLIGEFKKHFNTEEIL